MLKIRRDRDHWERTLQNRQSDRGFGLSKTGSVVRIEKLCCCHTTLVKV